MIEFDTEPPPVDKEVQFANGMAILFSAATFVANLKQVGAIDLVGIGISVGTGIAVWGAVRAATISVPAVASFVANIADDKPESKPKPTAVQPPIVNIDVESEQPLEAWQESLEDKLRDNDRFLVLGSQQWAIPNTVDVEHLFQLAEARATGKLRFMVSATALDEEAGISRNGKTPNAQTLIQFLLNIGAVQNKGDRRPMPWTELGARLFPDKFQSPPPVHANGQMEIATT